MIIKLVRKMLIKRQSVSFVDKILTMILENRARANRKEKQRKHSHKGEFQVEILRLTERERSNQIKASEFLQL